MKKYANKRKDYKLPVVDILTIDIHDRNGEGHWDNPCIKRYIDETGEDRINPNVFKGPYIRVYINSSVFCTLLLTDDAYKSYCADCAKPQDEKSGIFNEILGDLMCLLMEDVWKPGWKYLRWEEAYQFHWTDFGARVYNELGESYVNKTADFWSSPDVGLHLLDENDPDGPWSYSS